MINYTDNNQNLIEHLPSPCSSYQNLFYLHIVVYLSILNKIL